MISLNLPIEGLANLTTGQIVIGALLLAAVMLFAFAALLGRFTGLSGSAEVIASDTGQHRVKLIEDPKHKIRGKPDYIQIERVGLRKKIVPVELKPSRKSETLYEGDAMQVIAYLILLKKQYGRRVANFGRVKYANKTFVVEYTPEAVRRCLEIVERIREARRLPCVERNHNSPRRCLACSVREACNQRLV